MEEKQSTIQETLTGFDETLKAQDVQNFFISASDGERVTLAVKGNLVELISDSLEYMHCLDPEKANAMIVTLLKKVLKWHMQAEESKVVH